MLAGVEILTWVEATALAVWVRESISLFAYPSILAIHGIGLAFVVGASAAVGLRLLGAASDLPLAPMKKFFPVIWVGFWVNALSGLLLLISSATAMMTSTVFLLKLFFVALAVVCLRLIYTRVFGSPAVLESGVVPRFGKILAGVSLASWVLAIVAGRLTAYTILIASTFGAQ